MFWSRSYVKAKRGNFGNNGAPIIGCVVVKAESVTEAYASITEIEKTWGGEYYCVDSIRGPFAEEEEARQR